MKRSEINHLVRSATMCFEGHGWALPPNPKWDVTDFGLGDWRTAGLVCVNLAEEQEYCEKLMYAQKEMVTPSHTHAKKKEDIICRWGVLRLQLWQGKPDFAKDQVTVNVCGEPRTLTSGGFVDLKPGERVTLIPGVYHAFWPTTEECIIGEVSTANDDLHDNFFVDERVGRFGQIEEDELPLVKLVSD